MLRNITAIAVATALALPVVALAQPKADFSGTWTFDEARSDPPAGGPGGGGRGGRMGATPSKLVVKQTTADLTIEQTLPNGAQTVVYKLDGTDNINKLAMSESTTKATWEGANLVVAGKQKISTPAGEFEIDMKDVYSVAGPVLTITTTRVTPRGETTRKLVYNKA